MIPELTCAECTDFSKHFAAVEESMPLLLQERINRMQVVNVNDEAKAKIEGTLKRTMDKLA